MAPKLFAMEMINQLKKVTDKDLTILEDSLEIGIPFSYRKFLLEEFGGRPKKNNFYKKLDSGGTYDFDISAFLGVSENSAFDLLKTRTRMLGSIPVELLPIADDGIGNSICIGLKGEYADKIYLWLLQDSYSENEKPNFNNVNKLADSFEEFISYLI